LWKWCWNSNLSMMVSEVEEAVTPCRIPPSASVVKVTWPIHTQIQACLSRGHSAENSILVALLSGKSALWCTQRSFLVERWCKLSCLTEGLSYVNHIWDIFMQLEKLCTIATTSPPTLSLPLIYCQRKAKSRIHRRWLCGCKEMEIIFQSSLHTKGACEYPVRPLLW